MRLTSWAGLLILLSGVILIVYNLTLLIPNQTIPNLGLLAVLLGLLIFVAGIIQRRFIGPISERPASIVAWIVIAVGLLTAFKAFLQSQIVCPCPESAFCNCVPPVYNTLFYGGVIFSVGGIVLLARQFRRSKPQELPHAQS